MTNCSYLLSTQKDYSTLRLRLDKLLGKIGPAAKPVNDIPLSCAFNPLCFCNCEVFCDLQRTIIALFNKEN